MVARKAERKMGPRIPMSQRDLRNLILRAHIPFALVQTAQLYELGTVGVLTRIHMIGGSDATEVVFRDGGPSGTIILVLKSGIGGNKPFGPLLFRDGLHITIVSGTDAIINAVGQTAGLDTSVLAAVVNPIPPAPPVPPGPPFPSDDLVAWHTAQAITGLSDGASVDTWEDDSGNNNDLDGTLSAVDPIYRDGTTVEGINGLPAVRLPQTSVVYLEYAAHIMEGKAAGEIFFVGKRDNDPSLSLARSGLWLFSTPDFGGHFPYTNGVVYEGFGTSTRHTCTNPAAPLTSPFIYNVVSKAGEHRVVLNGTTLDIRLTNTVEWTSGADPKPRFGRDNAGYQYEGLAGELILFGAEKSAGDRADIIAYLEDAWGFV